MGARQSRSAHRLRLSCHARRHARRQGIVERYYGSPAQRAYFAGCSTGGRQALVLAQRFPADYDGIIAGCPVLSLAAEAMHVAASVRANQDTRGTPILKSEQLPLIHSAVLAACDAGDGLKDGLIADPRACTFDPNRMRCKGRVTADCLTPLQADAVRKIYLGARNSRGEALTRGGAVPGSELQWADAFIAVGGQPPYEERLANEYLANLAVFDVGAAALTVARLQASTAIRRGSRSPTCCPVPPIRTCAPFASAADV
ncbi:MAG: tannase/feruloyl esterase family alpha/beta hydrolase [Gammaproteobacteria bacterium]|nr:tannase/feruloyl esterase family alpha/beta hydrolase [Gammaproteobacteria bacterium]